MKNVDFMFFIVFVDQFIKACNQKAPPNRDIQFEDEIQTGLDLAAIIGIESKFAKTVI